MRKPLSLHLRKPRPAHKARSKRNRLSSRRRPAAVRKPKRDDPLSVVLASGALARLLTHLAVRPGEPAHLRGLQRATGLAPRSLQTELARLQQLGVVHREVSERQVRYRVNEQSPRWRLVRELVRELAEPTDVVRDALSDVSGVEAAFVFGSMARGTQRESSDIDVFVLRDDLDEERFARRTIDAGMLLRREINPVVMRAEELRERVSKESGFVRNVLSHPKRWVVGTSASFSRRWRARRTDS